VDIWLTPMPDRTLTTQERENMVAVSMLKDPFTVDPDKWTPLHTKLLKRAASYPEVDRIFVHPAIKKVLCEQAGEDRAWLAKVRPWWNHYYHFHVRVTCPPGASDCEPQKPLSGDDGCGEELTKWVWDAGESGDCRDGTARYRGCTQVLTYDEQAAARMWHRPDCGRLRAASPRQCRSSAGTGAQSSGQQGDRPSSA